METPIEIERTFRLGDYKSLRVAANADAVECPEEILITEVATAYLGLFIHNLFQAKLEANEQAIEMCETSIEQVKQVKAELLNKY